MNDSCDELLGDLETIRQLLDEAEQPISEETTVPLLEDQVENQVDHVLELNEIRFPEPTTALGSEADTAGAAATSRLSSELFEALLGEDWQTSSSDLLKSARGAIEAHRNQWTPDDTDELNDALRERIDSTLTRWLQRTVRNHLDELRTELLEAAEAAISRKVDDLVARKYPPEVSDHSP
jgi:hypothetical protein